MGYNIDLRKKFREYFNELEGYGLRSERFYGTLDTHTSKKDLADSMTQWLEAAYLQGAHDMAQDTLDTLGDYATSLAGINEVVHTCEQSYDAAHDSLMVYYTKVLDNGID